MSRTERTIVRRHQFLVAVVLTAALGGAAAVSATAQADEAHTYVALGDSYASGVGAGPYRDEQCRRSERNSYPAQWVAARTDEAPPPTFVDRTCSGATVADVQRHQLAVLTTGTRWVTVTIGGNDVGFSATLQQCLQGGEAACHTAAQRSIGTMTTMLPGTLDALFGQIRGAAPNAKVYVVGYPRLVAQVGAGRDCGPLTEGERATLNAAADTLAEVIRHRAARQAGFAFIDGRTVFAGHEACSAAPWIHGLRQDAMESFHPTADGYRAYADALREVTGG
jgi:lysophospholipase L1-like esterase